MEALESRSLLSVTFEIDYRFDSSGFFSDPARRAALQAAADSFGARLGDTLAAIAPGPGDNWSMQLGDPSTGQFRELPNAVIPADTIRLFVGARPLTNALAQGGQTGWSPPSGSPAFVDAVRTRGEPDAAPDGTPTDYGPAGGIITFDPTYRWYFGLDRSGLPTNAYDFYTVALHEIGHVLGFGSSPAWDYRVESGRFDGPKADALYGSPVPIDGRHAHWGDEVNIDGWPALMKAITPSGARKIITSMDLAGLADLGWEIVDGPSGPRTYEAERALLSGAVKANNNAGYTGTGFVDYVNLANDFAEFAVIAPSAGNYTLSFRYANGASAARGMELKVNGAVRPNGIWFDPTGAWQNWKTVTVTTSLNAGLNAVRLSAAGLSGPNVDSLTVAPTTEQPPPPPPPASNVYEAESAALSGAVFSNGVTGYSGSGFADYVNASNDYVEFTVNAATAGSYDLDFRYANGSAAARDLALRVNGQPVAGGGAAVRFAPTGAWTTWKTATVPAVTLAAGPNKVRLTATGQSGPNLDQLTVRPRTAPPPPPQPSTGTVEAEAGRLQGALVASNVGGYTGTGFVDYINPSGDFADFALSVPSAGSYRLTFRYANGGTTSRTMGVTLNGGAVAGGGVTFAPTGSWGTWRTVSLTVNLLTGGNLLRLTATGQSGPNLDNLTFSPA